MGETRQMRNISRTKPNAHHFTRPYGQIKLYLNVGSAPLLNFRHRPTSAQCWILSAKESKSPLVHFSETASVGQAVFIMWKNEVKKGKGV